MKHGKKPTVAQRRHIKGQGLIAENWLVCSDQPLEMVLEHRLTGQIRRIRGRGDADAAREAE